MIVGRMEGDKVKNIEDFFEFMHIIMSGGRQIVRRSTISGKAAGGDAMAGPLFSGVLRGLDVESVASHQWDPSPGSPFGA